MTRIAIFASGTGSNAARLIGYFANHASIAVALVVCNRPGAGVLEIAKKAGIPTLMVERERFFRGDAYLPELRSRQIDFLVLAGFLWKIPPALIDAYPAAIVNLHPALLPAHGGKGMYGIHVHRSVIEAGDRESGITIHYVDEELDHGDIIFQARCPVDPEDTPESLARKVQELEHTHFPHVVEQVLLLQQQV